MKTLADAERDWKDLVLSRVAAFDPDPVPPAPLTVAPPDGQLALFSLKPALDTENLAKRRNAYAEAAQDVVRAALGLQAVRINGRFSVCFDAWREEDRTHWEIKSAYSASSLVVYKWRLEKELATGLPVRYAILLHPRISGPEADPYEVAGRSRVFVLALEQVAALAAQTPLRMPKEAPAGTRHGYNRTGYRDGYHLIRCSKLRDLLHATTPAVFDLYGTRFDIPISRALF